MKKEKEETKQGCKKSRKRLRRTKTRKQRKYDDLLTLNDNFDFIVNWSNSYQIGSKTTRMNFSQIEATHLIYKLTSECLKAIKIVRTIIHHMVLYF